MLQLSTQDSASLSRICHALSTPLRVDIVRLLDNQILSCMELSRKLGYPLSTISTNVRILEDAGILICELLPAKNGSKKLCSLVYREILMRLGREELSFEPVTRYETSIPVGNYMNYEVFPSCGFVTDNADPLHFDSPAHFCDPCRIDAQLIWFRKGFVEYRVPLPHRPALVPKSLTFTLELCSESPGFNSKQHSDITMWINGVEIGTWTSPADFGDRRGRFTPSWWKLGYTQYGLLTSWCVTKDGTTFNDRQLSKATLDDLHLEGDSLTMRIGLKEGSKNIGGVNLFGEKFGDYPQSIGMVLLYQADGQAIVEQIMQ